MLRPSRLSVPPRTGEVQGGRSGSSPTQPPGQVRTFASMDDPTCDGEQGLLRVQLDVRLVSSRSRD
jgi:hypothetical protein